MPTAHACMLLCPWLLVGCAAAATTEDRPFSPIDMGGCQRGAVIEDGENADHQVIVHEGRNGYLYSFLDNAGSTVTPTAGRDGGTFTQSEGGANGSLWAARITGKIADGQNAYAGLGINLLDPKGPYDASQFSGVAFFARRGKGVTKVRLKVPDGSTDPDGKVCTECFNDFGADIELAETWQQFTIAFDQLGQLPGWGAPRPGSIDTSKIYGVQWQVATPGSDYDVWIDDVTFYGCKQ